MVNPYWRRKTCKYQSRKQTGSCITCKKDSSRRKADGCYQGKCRRWKPTFLENFLHWWNYGTMQDLFDAMKRRQK